MVVRGGWGYKGRPGIEYPAQHPDGQKKWPSGRRMGISFRTTLYVALIMRVFHGYTRSIRYGNRFRKSA